MGSLDFTGFRIRSLSLRCLHPSTLSNIRNGTRLLAETAQQAVGEHDGGSVTHHGESSKPKPDILNSDCMGSSVLSCKRK